MRILFYHPFNNSLSLGGLYAGTGGDHDPFVLGLWFGYEFIFLSVIGTILYFVTLLTVVITAMYLKYHLFPRLFYNR
jgi:hypothetical protein